MKVFIILWTILIFGSPVYCQNAVAIDVTALSIYKPYVSSPRISMSANGLPAPFQSPLTGNGGGILNTLESCRPCYLGSSFLTGFGWDPGANFINGFQIGGFTGDSKQVRFYLTSASPRVALNPLLRIKNRIVSLTAPAEIHGKIEIYDGNRLVAYDDDVSLTGTLKAEFSQYRAYSPNGDRRGFDFRNVTYSYSQ